MKRVAVSAAAGLGGACLFWLIAVSVIGASDQAPRALELLKLVFTWPVAAVVALLLLVLVFNEPIADLIRNMKLFATWRDLQLRLEQGEQSAGPAAPEAAPAPPGQPGGEPVLKDQLKTVEQSRELAALKSAAEQIAKFAESETRRANTWHFAFLAVWLAPNSQAVLRWMAGLNRPVTRQELHLTYARFGPSELAAVEGALASQNLIRVTGDVIEISPYGHEFLLALGDPGFSGTVQWATWLRDLAGRGLALLPPQAPPNAPKP